jgi:serine/threonine-protein kinase RsbW
MQIFKRSLSSSFEAVDRVVREAEALLAQYFQIENEDLFKINVMLREVLNNAVEHGNAFDESKQITVTIAYTDEIFTFDVHDEGTGVALDDCYEVQLDYDLRERARGFSIIKALGFEVNADGNKLNLTYKV